MARLFPFQPESPEVSREPRLVNLDDTTADEVFAALSSDTARSILGRLYDEPSTASGVAEAVDTSLQNARYHLDKLKDAGLIEEVDTWYSSRGTEMTVYAPTNEPLVVAAGREESTGLLRDALQRVLGAVGILALASVFVDRLARTTGAFATNDGGSDGESVRFTGNGDSYDVNTGADDGRATPEPEADEDAGALGVADSEPTEAAADTTTATEAPPGSNATETVANESTATVATSEPTSTVATVGDPTPTAAVADGGSFLDAAATLPPGVLFFAGGLLVIALGVGWWYAFGYRRGYV